LKVVWAKQTFVPGKGWIEVVDQMLREDVRVSGREGVEGLRGDRVEHRVDGVGPCGLQASVGLKANPDEVFFVDVVVDAGGLDLFVVIAGVRDALAIGAAVSVVGDCGRSSADVEGAAQYGQGRSAGVAIEREHLLIEGDQLRLAGRLSR
jgi:hypothetical protein